MSDFINRLLRDARIEIDEAIEEAQRRVERAQFLIDQFEPPAKRRRRKRRKTASAEERELDASLRVASLGFRDAEREQLRRGERELRYSTSAGKRER